MTGFFHVVKPLMPILPILPILSIYEKLDLLLQNLMNSTNSVTMLVKRENSIKKSEANVGVKSGVKLYLILTAEATWFFGYSVIQICTKMTNW